ncbi:helix-turn-helix domain-containing protein [Streptacidiphilus sp. PAMC 29251]
MPASTPESIGQRIARYRKMRHLTQTGLAEKAGVSISLLSKIEQGNKQSTPSVTASIARVLAVQVADLVGQPYLAELQADQLDVLIQPIRWALDVYDLGVDPEISPRPLADLAEEAERMCMLIRATDLRTAASELPALILETTTAAHTELSDQAWAVLASTYRTAYDVCTKLGYQDLSALALERMAWAAERGSDPIVASIRQYLRGLAYLRAGEYRTGRRLVAVGAATAALAEPGRARDVVTGQIHLGGAVLAARDKDGDAADGHLAAAGAIAERTGDAAKVYWLSFGPFNVVAHRVSALVDQDLYAKALDVAKTVMVPDDWPASRAAHHRAEIARAQLWTGRTDEALRSLLAARQLAPQQTRYSTGVRETIAGLLSARRAAPESLSNYAAWVGL